MAHTFRVTVLRGGAFGAGAVNAQTCARHNLRWVTTASLTYVISTSSLTYELLFQTCLQGAVANCRDILDVSGGFLLGGRGVSMNFLIFKVEFIWIFADDSVYSYWGRLSGVGAYMMSLLKIGENWKITLKFLCGYCLISVGSICFFALLQNFNF